MKYSWLSFKAIFVKDIVTELRAKQVLPTMIVLGMLIVWILRIASEAASVPADTIGPAALLIAFLFAGLLAQERSFAIEQEQDCIYGLLLAPVVAGTIYLAKLLVNVVILCISEIVIVPAAFLCFGLSVQGQWPSLIAVLMLCNIGISSVGTLFSAVVQLARTRGSLLSIVVLVILMPMMIWATSALMILFNAGETASSGTFAFVGSFAGAVKYMVAFDAIFVVACWLLFGVAIKE